MRVVRTEQVTGQWGRVCCPDTAMCGQRWESSREAVWQQGGAVGEDRWVTGRGQGMPGPVGNIRTLDFMFSVRRSLGGLSAGSRRGLGSFLTDSPSCCAGKGCWEAGDQPGRCEDAAWTRGGRSSRTQNVARTSCHPISDVVTCLRKVLLQQGVVSRT